MKTIDKKIGIDIFSGAGGLSLGAEMAGISVRYAIEIDSDAAKTYKKNHPDAEVICEDIQKINPIDLKEDHPFFIIMGGLLVKDFRYLTRFQEIWRILKISYLKSLSDSSRY